MVVWTLRKAKQLIIAVIGFTVLAIGIAMIVLKRRFAPQEGKEN